MDKRVDALREYLALLKQERYFDAHEVLEEAWHILRRDNDSMTNCFKGLINASIALEHLKRNKAKSKRVAQLAYDSYIKRSQSNNICNEIEIIYEIKYFIENRYREMRD